MIDPGFIYAKTGKIRKAFYFTAPNYPHFYCFPRVIRMSPAVREREAQGAGPVTVKKTGKEYFDLYSVSDIYTALSMGLSLYLSVLTKPSRS